jgi:uncharacterized protein (TIGR02611 family)
MPPAIIRSLRVYDEKHPLFGTYRVLRRVAIGVIGGTVLIAGIIMMVTPGPGIGGILAGLAILALEFAWARTWLQKARAKAEALARRGRRRDDPPPPAA